MCSRKSSSRNCPHLIIFESSLNILWAFSNLTKLPMHFASCIVTGSVTFDSWCVVLFPLSDLYLFPTRFELSLWSLLSFYMAFVEFTWKIHDLNYSKYFLRSNSRIKNLKTSYAHDITSEPLERDSAWCAFSLKLDCSASLTAKDNFYSYFIYMISLKHRVCVATFFSLRSRCFVAESTMSYFLFLSIFDDAFTTP